MKAKLLIGIALLFPGAVGSSPADRFLGGSGDGVDHAVYTGFNLPTGGQYGRFVGGGYDGFDSAMFVGYTPPTGGQYGRFTGGPYDGHAMIALHGISNPLAGDSDNDGVPDWWEGFHYKSLTLADADTDIDDDGRGSYFEYVSDTDPNDKASLLRVISSEHDDTIRFTFGTTSINRLYWIETSTTLQSGSWAPVTSPRVIGNSGNMELSTPNIWTTDHFFRISVAVE